MKKIIIPLMLVLIFSPVHKSFARGAKFKHTYKVIDDLGMVVSNADFKVNIFDQKNIRMSGWDIAGKTDTNGIFVVKDRAYDDMIYTVQKKGYYKTNGHYRFNKIKDGKWQPWNPTIKVILRERKKPIPMYAKQNIEVYIPGTNQWYGYDLMVGDWVEPYGKGEVGDFLFNVNRRFKSRHGFDGELTISFSNEKDGFQKFTSVQYAGSDFAWDYESPTNGYSYPVTVKSGCIPGNKGQSYKYYKDSDIVKGYFRIRSKTNEVGEIISAYYGKMPSIMEFDIRGEKPWSRFSYYLNLTPNDRNMESQNKLGVDK